MQQLQVPILKVVKELGRLGGSDVNLLLTQSRAVKELGRLGSDVNIL